MFCQICGYLIISWRKDHGNGRITRLVMNFILNRKKYPMLDIPYGGRNSYYNALERSQVKKDEKIFLQWFVKRYVKEYKQYL